MEKDLYAVLGLKPNAGTEEMKKAYRRLAQEYHPDRHQGDSEEQRALANERMVEISKAFRVLGNATERAAYDKKRGEAQSATAAARSAAAAHGSAPQRSAPPPQSEGRSKLGRDIAQDFLLKLCAQLKNKGGGVSWKEEPAPSRDWTHLLRSSEFGTGYSLLLYQTRDATPSLARQFVRNVEAFVKAQRSLWRNDYFVFVLAFEKLTSTDEVVAVCNKFERMGKSGPLTRWRAVIVLLDAHNMRSVFCGRPIPVEPLKQTFQILQGKW